MKKKLLIFFTILTFFASCIDEKFSTDKNARLEFSVDTLVFDTLFSTQASPTKVFKIFNKNKNALKINRIALRDGETSAFRINVDGIVPADVGGVSDIEILAGDSLYLFVELTPKEQNSVAPFVVEDEILFEFSKKLQSVKLRAIGQDAVILRGKTFSSDVKFTKEKPYLIFDSLTIAEGATLTIEAGARLYFHAATDLKIAGNLRALGTIAEPIILRGDRFDAMPDVDKTPYAYMSGQWGSVVFSSPATVSELENVAIIGATNAVVVEGSLENLPKISLKNVRIHLAAQFGVLAQNADLNFQNCEVSNCGRSCLYLIGGKNLVTHCTIANYYSWAVRSEPAVKIANFLQNEISPLYSAVFQNTIIFGSQREELVLQKSQNSPETLFNAYFSHCLIKATKSDEPIFNNVFWSLAVNPNADGATSADVVFVRTALEGENYFDFQLLPNSAAAARADIAVARSLPEDKNGKSRLADGKPDIGAYEF